MSCRIRRPGSSQRIGLLGEGDGVLLAAREIANDEARQRVFALDPHQMPGVDLQMTIMRPGDGRQPSRQLRARSRSQRRDENISKSSAPSALVWMKRRSPCGSTS